MHMYPPSMAESEFSVPRLLRHTQAKYPGELQRTWPEFSQGTKFARRKSREGNVSRSADQVARRKTLGKKEQVVRR